MPTPAIGAFLPTMSAPGDEPGDIAASARHAEDLGLESVWTVDQLVAGTGAPFIESVVALAAAAGATSRVRLGFGVVILPLRPDAALRVLPGLLSGEPTRLGHLPDSPTVQLAPGVTVPAIVVGGMSDAAMSRALDHDAGWFLLPIPPPEVSKGRARLAEMAEARSRPTPPVTAGMLTALTGDPALPDHDGLIRTLTDPDGVFGMPEDMIPTMLVSGGPAEIASRLAEYGDVGAERVVVSFPAGAWRRPGQLLAEARALLD